MEGIDEYRHRLDCDTRAMVDALRGIVAGSHTALSERIKWNAPSFAVNDDDRITLGIDRQGGVRLVLHRGAKSKDVADYQFDDVDRLAKWVASDRGVIVFKNLAEIESKRSELSDLCSRWLVQTT